MLKEFTLDYAKALVGELFTLTGKGGTHSEGKARSVHMFDKYTLLIDFGIGSPMNRWYTLPGSKMPNECNLISGYDFYGCGIIDRDADVLYTYKVTYGKTNDSSFELCENIKSITGYGARIKAWNKVMRLNKEHYKIYDKPVFFIKSVEWVKE